MATQYTVFNKALLAGVKSAKSGADKLYAGTKSIKTATGTLDTGAKSLKRVFLMQKQVLHRFHQD